MLGVIFTEVLWLLTIAIPGELMMIIEKPLSGGETQWMLVLALAAVALVV